MLQWMVAAVQRKRLTLHSNQPAEEVLLQKFIWQEHITPFITWYGLKRHSQTGQNITFYNVQPNKTLALMGEKYQDRKGSEDIVAVFYISMLMAAKIIH